MNYKKGDLEKYQLQIKRQVKLGNMSKAEAVVAILNYASAMFMPPTYEEQFMKDQMLHSQEVL